MKITWLQRAAKTSMEYGSHGICSYWKDIWKQELNLTSYIYDIKLSWRHVTWSLLTRSNHEDWKFFTRQNQARKFKYVGRIYIYVWKLYNTFRFLNIYEWQYIHNSNVRYMCLGWYGIQHHSTNTNVLKHLNVRHPSDVWRSLLIRNWWMHRYIAFIVFTAFIYPFLISRTS